MTARDELIKMRQDIAGRLSTRRLSRRERARVVGLVVAFNSVAPADLQLTTPTSRGASS